MWARNLNLAKPFFNECRLEHLHRRNEAVDEGLWAPVENLGAHTDVVDLGGRIERLDVGIDPAAGVTGICKGRDIAIGDGDGDEDAGVGKSFDDGGVDVEDPDPVDDGAGFKEVSDFRGWWKVVAEGSVVDADGVCGG